MNKFKLLLLISTLTTLFACTSSKPVKKAQIGYLKNDITQAELSNPRNYKRYYYTCQNFETGSESYLSTYFPLTRESRLPQNFGIYFQLDNGKIEPFDHIENRELNGRGSRFEVVYRSYLPINGSYVDLLAREYSSAYYKNRNGVRLPWLKCREA